MNELLTYRENMAKEIMEEAFIPALHELISKKNPKEYKKWNGNCCRQTAILGVRVLQELLPEYEWSAWDGIFDDIVMNRKIQYNHAWIFGKGKKGRRLLVDLSRQYHERLFISVVANRYPKDHPEYKNMIELHRKKLDVEKMINEEEYYTKLTGRKLLEAVISKMRNVKF